MSALVIASMLMFQVLVTGPVKAERYEFLDGTAITPDSNSRPITYRAGCDSCALLSDVDDDRNIFINILSRPLLVQQVYCQTNVGNAVINLQRDDGTPNNMLALDLVCSAAGVTTNAFVADEFTLFPMDKVDFILHGVVPDAVKGVGPSRITVTIKAAQQ